MALSKPDRELLVFATFAQAAGLLPNGTFESRLPPEPDILYRGANGSSAAFELVEIIDRDYSNSIARQLSTKDACLAYFESLPANEKTVFKSLYANADIFFDFRANLTLHRRRSLLRDLFVHLLSLPAGFSGDTLHDGVRSIAGIDRISIHRGCFNGPLFDAPSFVRVGDPTIEAIDRKLNKAYKPDGTLNLLAYIDGNPMLPDEAWLSNLDTCLARLDYTCQFESIYVFELRTTSIRRKWDRNSS